MPPSLLGGKSLASLASFSSCVSQEQYNKATFELISAQTQIQTMQTDLTKAKEQNQSLQKDLDESNTKTQTLQTNLTKGQEQNQSLQKDLDNAKSQAKTLQADITATKNDLARAQTKAQSLEKAAAYADFIDLLFYGGWLESNIPTEYKFADYNEYGLTLIQKATRLNDSAVDKYITQITSYYSARSESKTVTVFLQMTQHCLQQIKNLSIKTY